MNKIITTLESNSNIIFTEKTIGSSTFDMDWKMMQEFSDIENVIFPKEIIESLNLINGFKIEWSIEHKNLITPFEENFPDEITGAINILDPSKIIGMHLTGAWNDTLNHHHGNDNNRAREIIIPFDYYLPDYSECACFRIVNNEVDEHITFHSSQFGFYYSHISFFEYLEILKETLGMQMSREAIIFPESMERDKTIHYCKQLSSESKIEDLFKVLDKKIIK